MKKLALLSLIFLFACSGNKNTSTDNKISEKAQKIINMNYNSYAEFWQEIKQLEKKGLTKTAYQLTQKIYDKAKTEQNSPQLIKVLLYQSKYMMKIEENSQLKIIEKFYQEIAQNEAPTKNILENILANMYWQYYKQNRHKFAQRSKTGSKVDKTDFGTWDLQTLYNEIEIHYNNSLQEALLLQKLPVNKFKEIIEKGENTEKYRPTLYDLLAQDAVKFYQNNENAITSPAYKFEIDNPKFLANLDDFLALKINSKDSTSKQLKALRLYQNILRFRKNDKHIDALAMADFDRINYVYDNAVFDDKEQLFVARLKQFVQKYKTSNVAALAYGKIADQMLAKSEKYVAGSSDELKWLKKEALQLCEKTIKNYPDCPEVVNCIETGNQILAPNAELSIQKTIPEMQNGLAKISFKNLKSLAFAVYKIDFFEYNDMLKNKHNQDEIIAAIKKYPKLADWQQKLIDDDSNDYRSHSTETIIPKLPAGQYVLLAENASNNYAYTYFQVSDWALQNIENSKKSNFFVSNRNNGNIVADARVTIYKQKRKYVRYRTATTNKKGKFTFRLKPNYYYSYLFKVEKNNKIAYFNDSPSNYYRYDRNEDTYKIFTFTDRSIYRPGQTVYFKSIFLKKSKNKSEVVSNISLSVTLKDANGQKVETLHLTSNEYGSVQGNFVLPTQTLTGNFSIVISNNTVRDYHRFKVEEYKRPKFEAEFEKVEKSYKVNENISVHGFAKSYAGSSISNAKVTYRVKRQVQMPRWWYWYRPSAYSVDAQEIKHGSVQTNDKGEFTIDFIALPDKKVKKSERPVFRYEITADVTDINGETHSTSTVVSVAYHSLLANILMADKIDKSSKDSIEISTTNLNGVAQNSKGKVSIYKLQSPDRVLTNRPWTAPDIQQIDKARFISLFPHLPYDKQETDYHFWQQSTKYFEKDFDTEKSTKIALDNMHNWTVGKYVAILETTDKDGNKITDKAFFDIYLPTEKAVADNKLLDIYIDKDQYKPNDQVVLKMASSIKGSYIRILIEKEHEIEENKLYKLDKTYKTITVPVRQKDMGGFVIHYNFNVLNDVVSNSIYVSVPYPSDKLEIETISFRDKLLPGQKETWQFKLKGPKGEKVAAEILASMYDASLDAFVPHAWRFDPINYQYYYPRYTISNADSYGTAHLDIHIKREQNHNKHTYLTYDKLNWFGFRFWKYYHRIYIRGFASVTGRYANARKALSGKVSGVSVQAAPASESAMDDAGVDFKANGGMVADSIETNAKPEKPAKKLQVVARKNLQETAFFYPQLHNDKDGNISFSFTAPEVLTKWNVQLLAYDKKLKHAYKKLTLQTQNDLMLFPNAPRFVREGDKLIFSTKIANMTDKAGNGVAELEIRDAFTGKEVTNTIVKQAQSQDFTIDAKGNTQVSWTLQIPDNLQALEYKVMAQMGNHSDGEQNAWPVLSNRMLVTETMPMWIRSNQTKTFTLDKLKNNRSTSLKNHQLTLEITSNPAWYAVQALPYLMEYPYECSEQTFSRYYANALASHIAHSNPKIKRVFDAWKNIDTQALLSNLEKNQELKSMIIEETPWLRDAKSESEQKKRIGLLFDMNQMSHQLSFALRKLKKMQLNDGGFTWFEGGRYSSRYITQHIVAGFGHLKHLNVNIDENKTRLMLMIAVSYIDNELVNDYDELLERAKKSKDEKKFLEEYKPGRMAIHYFYTRSFYTEVKSEKLQKASEYFMKQAQKYWLDYSNYSKGMLALASFRKGDVAFAKNIIRSLDENSVQNEELGMYWKNNPSGWYWYQAPIETQALLIEAFDEITGDIKKVDEMRIWLLKNKQTNAWKTTKQTTEAVYALLLRGTDWLSVEKTVDVKIGNQTINPATMPEVKIEAGTGYFKKTWQGKEITADMASVQIHKKGDGIAWGGLYWQYFEDLDKITFAKTPLQMSKELFVRRFTDTGEQLDKISPATVIKVGDLVRVRIEIKVDRAMEYVHLKDMRASGFEPVNVISGYKWQDGLGYYESTRDASTNFFISYLPKGVYVFEYDLRANNAGHFSNGITTIQSMYAPEFSSHSNGMRVDIR